MAKKEEVKEEIKRNPKGEGLGAIAKHIQDGKNPMDAMAEKLVSVLFDKKLLLMTARLNIPYAKMIIRNYIINDFYLTYWGKCEAKIEIEPISVPPYYRKKTVDYNYPKNADIFRNLMVNLNDKLLQITVAQDGKGREEVVDIIKGLIGEVAEQRKILGMKI